MKLKIVLPIIAFLFSIVALAQMPQKITLMSGVTVAVYWTDSVKTETFYEFQLTGNKGRIANIKVRLKYGELQQLKDNKYKAKINANDEALVLIFTKYDPMSKQKKVLKEIVVPVKK